MPKLSEDSLSKRFACEYCEKTFRTRQGLSGHIQFKHEVSQHGSYEDELKNVREKVILWRRGVSSTRIDKEFKELGEHILRRWWNLLIYFHLIGLELNDNDFKNYFIQNFSVNNTDSWEAMRVTMEALKSLQTVSKGLTKSGE